MTGGGSTRGEHLFADGRRFRSGAGLIARIVAGPVEKLVEQIGARLARGRLDVTLPDGRRRQFRAPAPGPTGQVTIHDGRALLRLVTGGSVGWFQAWEAGEWTSTDPVSLFQLFSDNGPELGETGRSSGPWRLIGRMFHRLRRNSKRGSEANISAHYDLGNDFYTAWLDPTLTYSSALFTAGQAQDLETAQVAKVDALADRVAVTAGESVLEIGCGWGFLSRRLASRFGARVTAISLSDEQLAHARVAAAEEGVGGIDYLHRDYRDVTGTFDAVVSCEMVEALGREYWPSYLDAVARALRPGGRAAIQYIAMRDDLFEGYAANADFIQTYIFPGGLLIKASEFRELAEARGLAWRDQLDFGLDYAETLRRWRIAFDEAERDGRLPADFDERFRQLWRFYLMYCEGGFRGGGIVVSQVTLVKGG